MSNLVFQKHVFICTNQRTGSDRLSCGEEYGLNLTALFKKKINDAKMPVEIRAQRAGCLGICDFGPTVAVYPEGVFYVGVTPDDVDEIVESHLRNNVVVERLRLKKPTKN